MKTLHEIKYLIGSDEVGYGSLAGPIVVGGVKAPKDWSMQGLNDSKQLTTKQRRIMDEKLRNCNDIQFVLAERSNKHIDEFGILFSLKECYREIALKLYSNDSLIIIDGNVNFDETLKGMNFETLIKADSKVQTVMAASIIAKVYRDGLMVELSKDFPHYDWQNCKGYYCQSHLSAIKRYGYTEYHRKSYKLKELKL